MQGCPFGYHPKRTSRQVATEDSERADVDENLVLSALGVKVGRVVVVATKKPPVESRPPRVMFTGLSVLLPF